MAALTRRTGDLVCRAALAGRDHDEQLHDGVVDLGAAGLDDKHVLLPNTSEDADACFAIGELGELGVSPRHTQVVTYFVCDIRAGAAREDQGAAHVGWCSDEVARENWEFSVAREKKVTSKWASQNFNSARPAAGGECCRSVAGPEPNRGEDRD